MNTLDESKNALQKEAGDLRSSLREVEKARLEARRELQQVHNQVRLHGMPFHAGKPSPGSV